MGDLRRLEAFVVCADRLHLGRAASELGTARTTLSARLSSLEGEVGLRLIDRRHRTRIAVTQAGAALLPVARRAVAAVQEFERTAAAVHRGERGVMRVALTSELDADGERLLDALRTAGDGWSIETSRMTSHEAGRAMAVGGVECAIGRGVPSPRTTPGIHDRRPTRLEPCRVWRIQGSSGDPLVVACRSGWVDTGDAFGALAVRTFLAEVRRMHESAFAERHPKRAASRRRLAARKDALRERMAQFEVDRHELGPVEAGRLLQRRRWADDMNEAFARRTDGIRAVAFADAHCLRLRLERAQRDTAGPRDGP